MRELATHGGGIAALAVAQRACDATDGGHADTGALVDLADLGDQLLTLAADRAGAEVAAEVPGARLVAQPAKEAAEASSAPSGAA